MFAYLLITLAILLIICASIILNIDLTYGAESEFELARRGEAGDKHAKNKAWVLKHLDEVALAYKVLFFVLQLSGVFILALKTSLLVPLLISLASFLLTRYIFIRTNPSKSSNFKNLTHRLAISRSKKLVRSLKSVIKPLRYKKSTRIASKKAKTSSSEGANEVKDAGLRRNFYSDQEFIHNFEQDSEVLSDQLKLKIERTLLAPKTKLKDLMVGLSKIPKVDINLTLTPVIYDELHQKGYDMALVFQGAEDNLVGLIYLPGSEAVESMANSTALSSSLRVGDRMEQGLQYIPSTSNLEDLIAGFAQGGHNAVLITNPSGRVSGVLTARHLLGYLSGN